MIKREITTNLLKKTETFKVMALGEALQTPILLIGPPGVAKTAAVIDFAKATLGKLSGEDIFLLETDEGTRSNAIKGNIDLEKLTTENKYAVDSPVTKAKVVIINEIDKASPSLRNSLLGIMNEKILFNGKEQIDCVWTNFIATCNEIPDDEKDSPFWDRFLITHGVTRLNQSDMLSYYAKGGKAYSKKEKINIPEQTDIDAITINPDKLKKVLDVCHGSLSDRTLSFLPVLAKNVMVVWGMNEDRGLVKTVELVVSKSVAKELAKTLVPVEVRKLYDLIDGIGQCVSSDDYNHKYDELEAAYESASNKGLLTEQDGKDFQAKIAEEEAKLDFLDDSADADVLNQLAEGA